MAIFSNQATLTYNGNTTNSNIAYGEILEVLTATKTAVEGTYAPGQLVTYAVTLRNTGGSALTGVTVTDDRLLVMDFSDSYATGIQVVIVTEDSEITSIDDLEGKMIGTQMGTTGYIYASDTPENGGYGEDMVIPYDNGISAVMALKNGQVDAVIIDNAPAKEFVKNNPGLKILDGEWVTENYAIGFAKGNTELIDAVNSALAELIADGTVQKIVDKYISAE